MNDNYYNELLNSLKKINSLLSWIEFWNSTSNAISKLNDRLRLKPVDHEFIYKILNIKK